VVLAECDKCNFKPTDKWFQLCHKTCFQFFPFFIEIKVIAQYSIASRYFSNSAALQCESQN